MSEDERETLKSITEARVNFAILNLAKTNPRYAEVCRKHDESSKVASAILNNLSSEDKRTVLRHYEDEVHKLTFETDAAYQQGLRDSVRALAYFGAFDFAGGDEN